MSTVDPSRRERAAWALRRAIREAARAVDGAEIVRVPIQGAPSIMREALDDPLAGVRAALLARDVAVAEMRAYAEEARGAGRSWDEVGAALGIEPTTDGEPRAERAYRFVVEGAVPLSEESAWSRRPFARWTCSSCSRRVTDRGAFEPHPPDAETGHADTSPRHTHDIAAYSADRDEY